MLSGAETPLFSNYVDSYCKLSFEEQEKVAIRFRNILRKISSKHPKTSSDYGGVGFTKCRSLTYFILILQDNKI